MTILQGILLGLLQGIAEFLPISSSGHLAVAQHLFNLNEVPLVFDILLHLSTLAAVCIYFRKKIIRLFGIFIRWIFRKPAPDYYDETDLLSGSEQYGRKTIIAIIFTTLITGMIGIFTSKLIPDLPIKITCIGFIVTALLLIISSIIEKHNDSKKSQSQNNNINIFQALFIGLMQGIGTFPGISRSGSTIAGAQLIGVNRSLAGEFSFIVSIPAILGAFLLELKDLDQLQSTVGLLPLLLGCLTSFVSGYFALSLLMKLIKKGKLEWFATYLIPLGILGIIFF